MEMWSKVGVDKNMLLALGVFFIFVLMVGVGSGAVGTLYGTSNGNLLIKNYPSNIVKPPVLDIDVEIIDTAMGNPPVNNELWADGRLYKARINLDTSEDPALSIVGVGWDVNFDDEHFELVRVGIGSDDFFAGFRQLNELTVLFFEGELGGNLRATGSHGPSGKIGNLEEIFFRVRADAKGKSGEINVNDVIVVDSDGNLFRDPKDVKINPVSYTIVDPNRDVAFSIRKLFRGR